MTIKVKLIRALRPGLREGNISKQITHNQRTAPPHPNGKLICSLILPSRKPGRRAPKQASHNLNSLNLPHIL